MDGLAPKRRLRVFVVDDHDLFRTGLRALLEEEGFDVADSASAEAALRRLEWVRPDVVVVDMNMRAMSGVEAIPLMLDAAPNAAVLVLTIAADEARVLEAVHAGASGYLLKDAELRDIAAAIRAVAAGFGAFAPEAAGALLSSVRSSKARPAEPKPRASVPLSPREHEVLTLLTLGCDNGDIARQLYVSPSTVKHHVSRLLEKIGAVNRVQAATYAVRAGLQDSSSPPASSRAMTAGLDEVLSQV
jgi:two-component system, NarL family, nitrate/nitrite response regulator NarL